MLLKLDIMKAFDRLEWHFLIALLEHVGFGPGFINLLKASYSSATSAVRINGRLSPWFANKRSVRQGCPLSPLIFNIAIDALSKWFLNELSKGTIRGVEIIPLGQQGFHNLYADDVSLIVRDEPSYIDRIQDIFYIFGRASGLYVDWSKTKAAYLSSDPIPQYLLQQNWSWETDLNATKLLGFPIAQGISSSQMLTMVSAKLEAGLEKSRQNPSSLFARRTVANHLLTAQLWYAITWWNGTVKDLQAMQKKINTFIWGGQRLRARHRVDKATICAPKELGGRGLLSVEAQAHALSTKIILWALWQDRPPNLLRDIVQYYLRCMSLHKWGTEDFTWVFEGVRNPHIVGSKLWSNICASWLVVGKHLRRAAPANIQEWRSLPLWSPHVNHKDPKLVTCKTVANRSIRHHGIVTMAHVTHQDGSLIRWDQLQAGRLPPMLENAYRRLIDNIQPTPAFRPDRREPTPTFLEDTVSEQVWKFAIPQNKVAALNAYTLQQYAPACTFTVHNSDLLVKETTHPTRQAHL
jgi:hypothetical protein